MERSFGVVEHTQWCREMCWFCGCFDINGDWVHGSHHEVLVLQIKASKKERHLIITRWWYFIPSSKRGGLLAQGTCRGEVYQYWVDGKKNCKNIPVHLENTEHKWGVFMYKNTLYFWFVTVTNKLKFINVYTCTYGLERLWSVMLLICPLNFKYVYFLVSSFLFL